MKSFLILLVLLISLAEAKTLRILHTNDLHSQLKGHLDKKKKSVGGYARLKTKLLELKAQQRQDGIETVLLDAGDFSEGSLYYAADAGEAVFRLMESLGYDAIALGNHDYLMGATRLGEILKKVNLPLIATNMQLVSPSSQQLQNDIRPFRILERGEFRIGIVGPTTNDVFYKWRVKGDLKISPPIKVTNRLASELRSKTDVVIALSHLGVDKDKKLASKSINLDLIIGGHSHTLLKKPILIKNKASREVPIVQTGEHGAYVGEILLDIDEGKTKLLSYRLHPVKEEVIEHAGIMTQIAVVDHSLSTLYGPELDQVIVQRERMPLKLPVENYDWPQIFTDAIREEAQTDVSLMSPYFFNPVFPAGDVTLRSLLSFFPRFFDLQDIRGWKIHRAQIRGIVLRKMLELGASYGYPFVYSKLRRENLTSGRWFIDGKPLRPFKSYTVAVPEAFTLGLQGISPRLRRLILYNFKDTGVPVIQAVKRKLLTL